MVYFLEGSTSRLDRTCIFLSIRLSFFFYCRLFLHVPGEKYQNLFEKSLDIGLNVVLTNFQPYVSTNFEVISILRMLVKSCLETV